jgi:hypothetical protein
VLCLWQPQHGSKSSPGRRRRSHKEVDRPRHQSVYRIVERATRSPEWDGDVVHYIDYHGHPSEVGGYRSGIARNGSREPPVVDVENIRPAATKFDVHTTDIPNHAYLLEG